VRILHILPSLDPRGGGPMEALSNYGQCVRALGHSVEVLSLDDPASAFLPLYPLTATAIGPSVGGYAYNPRLVPWLTTRARDYDVIFIHGLWQYHAFGAWRVLHDLKLPYFVLPHGMLDPWFKTTYPLKHLKKFLYWHWADYRVLRDARAVLFTSEEERRLARLSFSRYTAREVVINYGTKSPPQDAQALRERFLQSRPDLQGKRILLFLSRIHEKKGCDLLIKAYARVAAQDRRLHLMVAGPDKTALVPRLRQMAQELGVAASISFPGMLQADDKWGAFHASDAFVLPSHQENFGVAVAEALGCRLPVLISDKVNIWREVQQDGCGFVAPDTVEGTEHNLRSWLALPVEQAEGMRQRARSTFEARYTAEATARSLLAAVEGARA